MADKIPGSIKKEVSRLRSEVRKLQELKKDISAFTGVVSGNYWTQTGMPWVQGEGRKAVLTEYFWQPIRGQPRRVDTNELRQFSQDFWVSACVKTIMDEVSSLDWDIVPKEEFEYDWVAEQITEVKEFLKYPNKNGESFTSIIRALLKDILEIDAGVIVKVFDINSYNFDELEPKSGAPMLKPMGQRKMTEIYVRDGASFLKEIDKFGFEKGYWQYSYQIPAHPMWFNKDEIVYIMEHPRSMSPYGYARTQSILDIVKSLHYSTLYNKRFFEESPIPDGALSLLDTNEVEMRSFMSYWNNEFKAQPHKVAVTNKDIKWQPFAVSQRELEFLETQKWYFNMVISAFGLTPTELGITEDSNRATSATQAELVKRKGIRPFLKLIENYLNKGLIPEFGYEGIEFQFIYDDPAEKKARLDNWQMELSMGVKTINEVRDEMGMEPVANGDVSNSFMDRMAAQTQQNPGQTPEENSQAPDFQGTKDREEANNGPAQKTTTKSAPDYKRMSYDDLISEHKKLVAVLEQDNPKEIKDMAEEQKKELESYIEESKKKDKSYLKGVDDGQYYHDQPISQPRRASGAMYQPQNRMQDTALPTPFQQLRPHPRDDAEMKPGALGDNYKVPGNTQYRNIPKNCPVCGQPTLSSINSLEQLEEDLRCTNCGHRFKSEELMAAPLMEEMANVLQQYNYSNPVMNAKSAKFTKELDLELNVKDFCGFDVSKSFPQASMFAQTPAYKALLKRFLKDLPKSKVDQITEILINSLKEFETLSSVADKIKEIIKDPERAKLIARTEVIRLANEGNLQRMEEKDQKLVKYMAAPEDGRLCNDCKKKDGRIYTLENAHGVIPTHPRCRCTFTEYEKP